MFQIRAGGFVEKRIHPAHAKCKNNTLGRLNPMSLRNIAAETLQIIERGHYLDSHGHRVDVDAYVERALEDTRLYTPGALRRLLAAPTSARATTATEVTSETTQVAAQRLTRTHTDVVLLNFASARNAGGGFLRGAKAQEEDVTRCSALYPCLLSQRAYYEANRRERSLLYTDHVIYSRDVPFFRVRNRELIDRPFLASVITAPAPNATEYLRRQPHGGAELHRALHQRAGYVLAVAKDQGHRCLLLGAWGCGVFGNEPADVASAFASWLHDVQFADAFDQVTFAIYDRSKAQANLRAFEAVFDR